MSVIEGRSKNHTYGEFSFHQCPPIMKSSGHVCQCTESEIKQIREDNGTLNCALAKEIRAKVVGEFWVTAQQIVDDPQNTSFQI